MADTEEPQDAAPKKKSKMPLIIGLVLALSIYTAAYLAEVVRAGNISAD